MFVLHFCIESLYGKMLGRFLLDSSMIHIIFYENDFWFRKPKNDNSVSDARERECFLYLEIRVIFPSVQYHVLIDYILEQVLSWN